MGSTHSFRRDRASLRRRGARALRRAVSGGRGMEPLEPRRLLAHIVVNTAVDENIADNPTTSLREALAQASLLGADDQITFDPDVFTPGVAHTIDLLDGALSVPAGGGQITIDGPGAAALLITGGGGDRALELDVGADLVVRGVAFTNDDEFFHARGAAILNAGTLALHGVTLSGNAVLGNPGGVIGGGAIYNTGALTIEDSLLSDNTVHGGGGAATTGPTSTGGSSEGGAIYSSGDLTVRRTRFENNSAEAGDGGLDPSAGGAGGTASGGAIYSLGGTLIIEESVFQGNRVVGGPGREAGEPGTTAGHGGNAYGGAVVRMAGDATIRDSEFRANAALGGAGGDDVVDGYGGDARGGAVYTGGALTIEGGSFADNAASGGGSGTGAGGFASGGAVANVGDLAVVGADFSDNAARGGDGLLGGGASGGAIYTTGGGQVAVTETTIDANGATAGTSDFDSDGAGATGGGIAIHGGDATITGSTVSNNIAFAGDSGTDGGNGRGGEARGGGVFNAGQLRLANATVHGNTAIAGDGNWVGDATGDGGDARGGGVYNDGGLAALNATVVANRVTAGSGEPGGEATGGGVYNDADAALTNTIVAHNVAGTAGANLAGAFTLVHALLSESATVDHTELAGSHGNIVVFGAAIGPLQDNGGPTHTAAPFPESAAIDAGLDADAIGEFGPDGTDQRGFDRFVGTVDIGAVEVQPPQIEVRGNGTVIVNDDATPGDTDHTNFGNVAQGATGPTRTYTVTNVGEGTLELTDPALPSGYVVTEPLDAALGAGESDTFTVRLNTGSAGTFAGAIVIGSNDPDDATFTFAITGAVTAAPGGAPPVKINFQPSGRPVPSGYLADAGLVFGNRGNGFSYGWNQSIGSATRDRNITADQKLDTLVHTQLYGARTWEIGVPNGTYSVKLVAGDPRYFDSVYKINVEGVLTVNGTPTSGSRFVTGTRTVTVNDGKLTVTNASGAVNNKLNYIEIAPVAATVKINFQPAGRPVPGGYLADTGAGFGTRGNGYSYGWNQSASSFARDRNVTADQKLDTLIHTQLYGVRTWELGVANGTYNVKLVAGDPAYFDSVYKIDVEGELTVSGTPTSANRFVTGTQTVAVSDGRLTISNASGSVNNKLAYVEVTRV